LFLDRVTLLVDFSLDLRFLDKSLTASLLSDTYSLADSIDRFCCAKVDVEPGPVHFGLDTRMTMFVARSILEIATVGFTKATSRAMLSLAFPSHQSSCCNHNAGINMPIIDK
jgi:hypothetical protein